MVDRLGAAFGRDEDRKNEFGRVGRQRERERERENLFAVSNTIQ